MQRRTLFTDAFTRADENPLVSPWEAYATIDTLQVVNGRGRPSVGSPAIDAYMRHNGSLPDNQWASATIMTLASAFMSIHLRKAAPNALSFYYLQAWRNGGVEALEIGKVVAGTQTTILLDTTSGIWAPGSSLLFDAFDQTLTGYVQGAQKIQTTDSDLIAGSAGLSAYVANVANAEWDDFASGDFIPTPYTPWSQLAPLVAQ